MFPDSLSSACTVHPVQGTRESHSRVSSLCSQGQCTRSCCHNLPWTSFQECLWQWKCSGHSSPSCAARHGFICSNFGLVHFNGCSCSSCPGEICVGSKKKKKTLNMLKFTWLILRNTWLKVVKNWGMNGDATQQIKLCWRHATWVRLRGINGDKCCWVWPLLWSGYQL